MTKKIIYLIIAIGISAIYANYVFDKLGYKAASLKRADQINASVWIYKNEYSCFPDSMKTLCRVYDLPIVFEKYAELQQMSDEKWNIKITRKNFQVIVDQNRNTIKSDYIFW